MVVVVAGVPVEVEAPLGSPELAGTPVIARHVITRRSAEVAVVIVAVNIAVVVVMTRTCVPIVTPLGMPVLTGAPMIARQFAHLSRRDGRSPSTCQSEPRRHDECCCCAARQCFHPSHHNTEICAPALRLSRTRWQCSPKSGVSNGIGLVGPLRFGPL